MENTKIPAPSLEERRKAFAALTLTTTTTTTTTKGEVGLSPMKNSTNHHHRGIGGLVSRLEPMKPTKKKRIPSTLRKRGEEWTKIARNGGNIDIVPKTLRIMGIDVAESPSGFNDNYIVETICAANKCTIETLEQIDRDLPRTYPEVDYFSNTDLRDALGRVLSAVALEYPNVGYVQGMNFLGGNILLHCNGSQDKTFQLFRYLMENPKYMLLHVFQPDLPNLKRFSDILESFLAARYPQLHQHFHQIGLEPLFYSQNWIMTLYAYMVPFLQLADIWDRFFAEGWPCIFRIALVFFDINEEKLLDADFEKAASILRSTAENPPADLCQRSDRIHLTPEDLELIRKAVAMQEINIPPPEQYSNASSSSFPVSPATTIHDHGRESIESSFTILSSSPEPSGFFSKSIFGSSSLSASGENPPVFVRASSIAFGDVLETQ